MSAPETTHMSTHNHALGKRLSNKDRTDITSINAMVADEHGVMRSLLVKLLSSQADIRVGSEATCASEVLESLTRHPADLLLLDLALGPKGGLQLIYQLRQRFPRVPVLVLGMHLNASIAQIVLDAGALGYVTKDCDADELLLAVRAVVAGMPYIEKRVAETVSHR